MLERHRLLARLAALCCWVGLGVCATASAQSPGAPVTLIDEMRVSEQPSGEQAVTAATQKLLPRWDLRHPGQGGRATYETDLPVADTHEPMALLFYRVGNQARVSLNNEEIASWGQLGDPAYDAAKEARLVTVPARLLRAGVPNRLVVEVSAQPLRWGGLSPFAFGPRAVLADRYATNQLLRNRASLIFAVSMALMGGLAAALWWQQREPLFGYFALAAALGVVRHVDRISPTAPLPWPLWGGVVNAAYAASLGLMIRFAVLAVGAPSAPMLRLLDAVTVVAALLGLASMALGVPWVWTFALELLAVAALLGLVPVVRSAVRDRSALAWALLISAGLAVASGLIDIARARYGVGADLLPSLTSHGVFLLVLVMAWIVVDRYGKAVKKYKHLSDGLAQRVAEREAELRHAYEALQAQQMQQAVMNERQRLMRDIHDGVGAQLVGLVSLASAGPEPSAAIAEQARLALEELHLAVDALQPAEGDLAVVLGTLRYRLSARLQAAGLDVDWDVEPLPPLAQLTPSAVAQLQRILLEAITNVVKHARATRITLKASGQAASPDRPAAISLVLADNGCGFDAQRGPGLGLANMQARAQAIGALLRVDSALGNGTQVRLDWALTGQLVPPPVTG